MAKARNAQDWDAHYEAMYRAEIKRALDKVRAVAYSCLAKLQPYNDEIGLNHASDIDQDLYLGLRTRFLQIVGDPKLGISDPSLYAEVMKYEAVENQ